MHAIPMKYKAFRTTSRCTYATSRLTHFLVMFCLEGGRMSISYWKTVGESVAKGLGEKTIRHFGVGGKVLGRTGAVLGIGFLGLTKE